MATNKGWARTDKEIRAWEMKSDIYDSRSLFSINSTFTKSNCLTYIELIYIETVFFLSFYKILHLLP